MVTRFASLKLSKCTRFKGENMDCGISGCSCLTSACSPAVRLPAKPLSATPQAHPKSQSFSHKMERECPPQPRGCKQQRPGGKAPGSMEAHYKSQEAAARVTIPHGQDAMSSGDSGDCRRSTADLWVISHLRVPGSTEPRGCAEHVGRYSTC